MAEVKTRRVKREGAGNWGGRKTQAGSEGGPARPAKPTSQNKPASQGKSGRGAPHPLADKPGTRREAPPARKPAAQASNKHRAPKLRGEQLGQLPPGVDPAEFEALVKQLAPPPLERRALSHVGGKVEFWGEKSHEEILRSALKVSSDEAQVRAHIHGFHSYPARLHPVTAQRLIRGLTRPGYRVLDPFCGSGTVAVEASLAGARMGGSDANPFAIALASLKVGGKVPGLIEAAQAVVDYAEDRRIRKAGPSVRYPEVDKELFDIHVLLELDGLKSAINDVENEQARQALGLVLTSLLTKVSKKPGDTRKQTMKRRLATGFTIRSFMAKAEELAERLSEYERLLPKPAYRPHLEVSDARRLHYVEQGSIELVLTSPPYPGVYDYVKHHEARMRWLGLDSVQFSKSEIGSQRQLGGQDFARAAGRWAQELEPCLKALARGLAPRGHIILVIADTVLGGRAWYADRALQDLAPQVGLRLTSVASQRRPVFLQGAERLFDKLPRREHLLLLTHA